MARPGVGLWRALAVYTAAFALVAAGAYVATRVIGLPAWVTPGAISMMAIGFPVVLVTALVEGQRRTRFSLRHAWMGGAWAIGGFALMVAGYMAMRQLGIGRFGSLIGSRTLAENDRIVIADMSGPAADTALGAVLVEGLRVGLSESKALRLVSPERTRMILAQMRTPNAPVTGATARDVAVRAGAKAVLDGDVRRIGSAYALTVRLLRATDAEPLTTLQETAKDDADFTAAAGRLANKLRERVGESLRSVNASAPLEDATTASLPALRKYTEGHHAIYRGEYLDGLRLMREAVALDSNFVSAYRELGWTIGGYSGMRVMQSAMLQRGYAIRDRATPAERELTAVAYWSNGPTPNLDSADAAAKRAVAVAPDNALALAAAAFCAYQQARYDDAIGLAHRTLAADSAHLNSYYYLALAHAELGHVDSARAMVNALAAIRPEHLAAAALQVSLMNLAGNDSGALARALSVERMTSAPLAVSWGASFHRGLALRAGRLREAHAADLASLAGAVADPGAARLERAAAYAYWRARFLGDSSGALRMVDSALRASPLDSMPPRARPYALLAEAAQWMNRPDLARRFLDGQRRDDPAALINGEIPALPMVEYSVAMAEHRFADAAAAAKRALRGGGRRYVWPRIALAFDRAGQKDSATVYYERFINSTSLDLSVFAESHDLASVRKRLGELYEERGTFREARAMYEALAIQWKTADPELQPLVRDVRARAQRLEARSR